MHTVSTAVCLQAAASTKLSVTGNEGLPALLKLTWIWASTGRLIEIYFCKLQVVLNIHEGKYGTVSFTAQHELFPILGSLWENSKF